MTRKVGWDLTPPETWDTCSLNLLLHEQSNWQRKVGKNVGVYIHLRCFRAGLDVPGRQAGS